MKRCRFEQNTSFHLKEKGAKKFQYPNHPKFSICLIQSSIEI